MVVRYLAPQNMGRYPLECVPILARHCNYIICFYRQLYQEKDEITHEIELKIP